MYVSTPLQSATLSRDVTSVFSGAETATRQTQHTVTSEKNTTGSGLQNTSPLDTVALSRTAVDMSNSSGKSSPLSSLREPKTEKQKNESAEKQLKDYLAAGKNFPPFLGNSSELKAIKQMSLSLYREVLLMIIPPPLNISPGDLEMIKNQNAAKTTETSSGSNAA